MQGVSTETLDDMLETFHDWATNLPTTEKRVVLNNKEIFAYILSPYDNGNFTHYARLVDNYMLTIETCEGDIVYDVFIDSIEIMDGDLSYDNSISWEIDLTDFDLSSSEEMAFQLSTAYNFGCSTESIKLLLQIVQSIRDRHVRL